MILADTSAWIEFVRRTGTAVNVQVRELLSEGQLAVTDVVALEVLAGIRDTAQRSRLRRVLFTCDYLPTATPDDYLAAADLYATCRRAGTTIRALDDCLIAAVAIRHDVPVLHDDRDFEALAAQSALRLA